jgi:hypothetical protein
MGPIESTPAVGVLRKRVPTMSDRITRKDAEQALRVYCQRAGLPFGHYATRIDDDPKGTTWGDTIVFEQNGRTFNAHEYANNRGVHHYVITGGLALDCAYGGYQVQQIIGMDDAARWPNRDGRACTGVRTPFGGGYQTARDVYQALRGAIEGLELAERATS